MELGAIAKHQNTPLIENTKRKKHNVDYGRMRPFEDCDSPRAGILNFYRVHGGGFDGSLEAWDGWVPSRSMSWGRWCETGESFCSPATFSRTSWVEDESWFLMEQFLSLSSFIMILMWYALPDELGQGWVGGTMERHRVVNETDRGPMKSPGIQFVVKQGIGLLLSISCLES